MVESLSNARNQVMGHDSETRRLRRKVLLAIGGLFAIGLLTSMIAGGPTPLFIALLAIIVLLLVMATIGEREDRRWLLLTLATLLCAGLLIGREAFPLGLWHAIEDVVGPHGTLLRQIESTWR